MLMLPGYNDNWIGYVSHTLNLPDGTMFAF